MRGVFLSYLGKTDDGRIGDGSVRRVNLFRAADFLGGPIFHGRPNHGSHRLMKIHRTPSLSCPGKAIPFRKRRVMALVHQIHPVPKR